MMSFLNMRTSKLLIGAALVGLGLASTASAALQVDVRAVSIVNTSGFAVLGGTKSVTLAAGDKVTVEVHLTGLETETGGTNGLGSYNFSVRSLGESATTGNADGMVNATASSNGQSNPPFDFAYSQGTLQDSDLVADADTDIDAYAISGTQLDGGAPYQVGIGNGTDIVLGTATFTAGSATGTLSLNTYFNGSGGTLGGLVIKALTSTATDDTNGVSATNLGSAAKIGTVVGVTLIPVPEPTSAGLLGVAALGLLKRRRNA